MALTEQTGIIPATGPIILQAKFDAADVGGDLNDISAIVVGGASTPIAHGVPLAPAEARVREVEDYRELAERRPWRERALDVIRALMSSEADVQALLASVPAEADLQVSVHIGYKTRRRSVSRAPMQQMLRNLPEGEIKAIGKHGPITGTDVRLSYPARILQNGSLLNPNDAIPALREAYTYFIENGKIEP
jgi:hypothetical protein